MCGFAGFLTSGSKLKGGLSPVATAMNDAIRHRGPDDSGVWEDAARGIVLGHRRLSIIDLSAAGHQPMPSESGRYVIAYNGEIYNYRDIRAEIESISGARQWRGHSDTEVLLAGIELWGLKATLERTRGMFAIALWDREAATLSLARDRVGEKPLYYGWHGGDEKRVFLFGSELSAIKKYPDFTPQIDRGALTLYLRHGYVPAPYSIYEGISKLTPGTIVTVSLSQPEPVAETFWSFAAVARQGQARPFTGSAEQSVDQLNTLALKAVERQMVSDVPIGAFLSGGIDSSTVVALMQAQSAKPVKTFTIGFAEEAYNEAKHAKAVAAHLGTEHHELYVDPKTALSVIPDLPVFYSEPFADSSQIPTFLVSKLARSEVTVSLSGDAGDELFGGYNRYAMTSSMWSKIAMVPAPVRSLAAKTLTAISPSTWDRIGGTFAASKVRMFGDKVHKGAGALTSNSVAELYHSLVSQERNPALWVINGYEPATYLTGRRPDLTALDDVQSMMVLDGISYLPDDILVKVDRASMAVSLESRVPFLDPDIIAFAWSLPLEYKIRAGVTKWPLRELLYRYVPKALIDRPKMGFGIPVDTWLRGPLKDWAEDLLDDATLRADGIWDVRLVRDTWDEHLSGRRNWSSKLWAILMFQAWYRAQ
jgi:asparagine synthase (glutamine-hydrolysing)